jgi:hypothetical protein
MASNRNPIRGPEWSTAQLVRDSAGVETRENKGLLGLRKEFNAVYDRLSKGVDEEAAATVEETNQKQKKGPARSNSDPLLAHKKAVKEQDNKFNASSPPAGHQGAFSFLNEKK